MSCLLLKKFCWIVILLVGKLEVARPQNTIQFGVLFEGEAEVAKRALRVAVADFNSQTENRDTFLRHIDKNVTRGNSLNAHTQGCDLTAVGVMSLVSVASGSVDIMIKSISNSMKVPLLQVGQWTTKTSTNYVYTSQPSTNLLLLPVLEFALKKNIFNSILVYDDTIDTSMIQDLSNKLFEQSRKIGFPNNFLIRVGSGIEGRRSITDIEKAVVRIKNLFKRNRLIAMESVFIFADVQVTSILISRISQKLSKSYNNMQFVVANTNIINKDLQVLQAATTSKVTVIKQYFNERSERLQRFVQMWNKDLMKECNNCSQHLQANDIPLQAYYIADGIRHFGRAVIRLRNENKYIGPSRLQCRSGASWPGGDPIMKAMKELNTTGILTTVSLNQFGANKVAKYEILSKAKGKNKFFLRKDIWNSDKDKDIKNPISFQNITTARLRIATVEEAPFVVLRTNTNGERQYEGFAIDVLKAIAKTFKFQYQLYTVPDGKYGTRLPNGSWNGLIGELVTGKADLAVAAMTITHDREVVVDFAKRYMDYSVGIVIKRSQLTSNLFSFIEPFHTSVWFCISSSLVLVVVFIYFLNQVDPKNNKTNAENQKKCKIGEVLWFAYSSLMQQGSELRRITFPVQIVIGFWWLFTLIVVSSYTANLAAFLTVQRMDSPIRSFSDLTRQQNIQYGTVTDTSIYDYIMRKGQEAMEDESQYKMMAKMINSSSNRLSEAKEGFEKAASENFAFLWDVAVIEYEVIRHKACTITTVSDSIYDKGYGFALQHGSPYRDELSHGILALQENGDIDKMRKKWWPRIGKCALSNEPSSSRGAELTLDNFMGIFFVLVAGILIACLIAAIEIAVSLIRGKPYPPRRNKNATSIKEKSKHGEYNIRLVLSKKELLRQLLDEVCSEKSESIENNDMKRDDSLVIEEGTEGQQSAKSERNVWIKRNRFNFNSTLKRSKNSHGKAKQRSNITFPKIQSEDQASYVMKLKNNTTNEAVEAKVLLPEVIHQSSMHHRLSSGSNEPQMNISRRQLCHGVSEPTFSTLPRKGRPISQNSNNLSFCQQLDDHMNNILIGQPGAMNSSIRLNETMTLGRADLIAKKELQTRNLHQDNAPRFAESSNCTHGEKNNELIPSFKPNPFFKKSSV